MSGQTFLFAYCPYYSVFIHDHKFLCESNYLTSKCCENILTFIILPIL